MKMLVIYMLLLVIFVGMIKSAGVEYVEPNKVSRPPWEASPDITAEDQ